MDEAAEDICYNAYNDAKKQGFKNGMNFLLSRGVPLTTEDVFLSRTSSPQKASSVGSPVQRHSTSPDITDPHTPHSNFNENDSSNHLTPQLFKKQTKSPLQQYKATRAAEDKARNKAARDRIKGQALLTASMIKRKRAEAEAKYNPNSGASSENKEMSNAKEQTDTPLLKVNMQEDFNTPSGTTVEGEGSELSAMSFEQMSPPSSNGNSMSDEHRAMALQRGEYAVSDVTTPQSQPSYMEKMGQEATQVSMHEMREDMSRMKLTIDLLKESNMNIISERKLSEEMYQDEIEKLKVALKAANFEINGDKAAIVDSSSSELDNTDTLINEASNDETRNSPLPKSSNVMVSITRRDSIGSAVSAVDCADVKIDDIKGKLLKKFGWTEIDESTPDGYVESLLKEIELLKQENKRLVGMLKAENIEVTSVVEIKYISLLVSPPNVEYSVLRHRPLLALPFHHGKLLTGGHQSHHSTKAREKLKNVPL